MIPVDKSEDLVRQVLDLTPAIRLRWRPRIILESGTLDDLKKNLGAARWIAAKRERCLPMPFHPSKLGSAGPNPVRIQALMTEMSVCAVGYRWDGGGSRCSSGLGKEATTQRAYHCGRPEASAAYWSRSSRVDVPRGYGASNFIGREAGFTDGITPPSPISPEPVVLLHSCLGKEFSPPERHSIVLFGSPSYFLKDVSLVHGRW